MMISKTFMPSVLMLAISTALVGCGGGGSGGNSSSSNGTGTETPPNNSGNNPVSKPDPVTCSETQYLENGTCKNKSAQTIQPLQISRLLKGQLYQLVLKTNHDLAISFSSNSPSICNFEHGELKALDLGKCNLKLSQTGTTKILPLNTTMTVDVIDADTEILEMDFGLLSL